MTPSIPDLMKDDKEHAFKGCVSAFDHASAFEHAPEAGFTHALRVDLTLAFPYIVTSPVMEIQGLWTIKTVAFPCCR
jgi:hypothetical protein